MVLPLWRSLLARLRPRRHRHEADDVELLCEAPLEHLRRGLLVRRGRVQRPSDALQDGVAGRAEPARGVDQLGLRTLGRLRRPLEVPTLAQPRPRFDQPFELLVVSARQLVDDPRRRRRLRQPLDLVRLLAASLLPQLGRAGVPRRRELLERERVEVVHLVLQRPHELVLRHL
jgi:hypothetical protein